MQKKRLRIKK
uniref:Uncharacterized protein n=1 Tax=Rhizophora mucronata TaxID=61149 RepID=A0A2P2QDZ6_RHIMU